MASLLLIPIVVGLISQSRAGGTEGPPNPRCGSYSLHVALRALGIGPSTFAELEKSIGPPDDRGYSMAQLDEQARKFGATTLGVKTTLPSLLARDEAFACVCLIRKNHFVLLQGIDEKNHRADIIDSLTSYQLPVDTFNALWGGEALLIGRGPLAPEEEVASRSRGRRAWIIALVVGLGLLASSSIVYWRRSRRSPIAGTATLIILAGVLSGCGVWSASDHPALEDRTKGDLVVDPPVHRLGSVPLLSPGETRVVKTVLRNMGKNPIFIQKIQESCGCTTVSLDSDRIAPGSQVLLTSRVALGIDTEPRRSFVSLVTSDSARPAATVAFEWQVVNPLRAVPAECNFFRLSPGERKSSRIALVAYNATTCGQLVVRPTSSSPLVSCFFVPSRIEEPRDPVTSDQHSAPVGLGELRIEVVGDDEERVYKEYVTVSLVCGDEEQARCQIPITWELSPQLYVIPRRSWLDRRQPGETVSTKILVSSADRRPFRITRVSLDVPRDPIEVEFDGEQKSTHAVKLTMELPRISGPWRRLVTITTDRDVQREITFPISAIIDDITIR